MKTPVIYPKEMWLKLRNSGVVSFTDEELNSGKQPFKTDNKAEYYIDTYASQPKWLQCSRYLHPGAMLPIPRMDKK